MATTHVFTLSDVYRQSLEGTWVAQGWNAAWFGGGYTTPSLRSRVDRVIFASDTATAVAKGPLSSTRYKLAAHGSPSDAWFGGGAVGPGVPGAASTVDRVIFSADTATAVAKGPLSLARFGSAASGNTTDAWFGGGGYAGSFSTVQRIIFSVDTATAVTKGPLSGARYELAAHGSTTDGWYGAGYSPAGSLSRVDRIIFASDTATAVAKGPLGTARLRVAAHGSETDAWFGGGVNTSLPSTFSTVDRVIFSSDTATAVAKGSLSAARYKLTASGSETDAWFGGGTTVPGALFSTVDRVIFSADTATAVAKGPLSVARSMLAAD